MQRQRREKEFFFNPYGRVSPVWVGLKILVLWSTATMYISACGQPQELKTESYFNIGDTLSILYLVSQV
jgi:hypothetical protein